MKSRVYLVRRIVYTCNVRSSQIIPIANDSIIVKIAANENCSGTIVLVDNGILMCMCPITFKAACKAL